MKTDKGISLQKNQTRRNSTAFPACGMIPIMLLAGGYCLLLNRLLPGANVSWWVLFAVCAAAGIGALLLPRKYRSWVLPGGCVLLALGCLLLRQWVMAAAGTVMNDITDALSHVTGRIYLDYYAADTAWAALIPLMLFCGLLTGSAVDRGNLLWLIPILLPVGVGGMLGLLPMGAGWLMFITGAVLVPGDCRMRAVLTRFAVVLLCTALALGTGTWLQSRGTEAWQSRLHAAVHSLRYAREECSMPEGKLADLGAWKKNDTPALAVTMETPQRLYLRGGVWETYTGSRWETLAADVRGNYSDLFYWLHENGFFGQSQIAGASAVTGEKTTAAMQIRTLGACAGHSYLPYALADPVLPDAKQIGDIGTPNSFVNSAYLPGSLPAWHAVQRTLSARQGEPEIAEYLTLEHAYSDYVYQVDLQLTETSRAVLERQLEKPEKNYTLSEIRNLIRNYLGEKMHYDSGAVTHLHGGDFLQDTLESGGSGYSVHYATAAVLMLRYFGVPARYVEGYCLSAADAAKAEAGTEIVLTGENAHAWAEYYLEGVGFVPFEVTPGYVEREDLYADGEGGGETQKPPEKTDPTVEKRPEKKPEGGRSGLHHFKKVYISCLVLLPLLLITVWIAGKRIRLAYLLKSFRQEDDRRSVTGWYSYAMHLKKLCPVTLPEDRQAASLNREAQFSDHVITPEQREEMERYAQNTVTAVREKGTFFQKLRWRWIDGIL